MPIITSRKGATCMSRVRSTTDITSSCASARFRVHSSDPPAAGLANASRAERKVTLASPTLRTADE